MLCFYLEDHHTEPTQQNHFLKELVDKGVYNEAFREDWVQSRRRNRVCKSELEFKLLIIPKKTLAKFIKFIIAMQCTALKSSFNSL